LKGQVIVAKVLAEERNAGAGRLLEL